ncbi:TPA: hypothetical protein DEO28_04070 [Candidatus Dependentiae bacterium]|nr:MAG: General secretion pathway protein G [candidate division TM6 bacterium GW2011_GWE2_31_21]KKP53526.1 MAG: General secretion pathway protein G [candidate division TM6 bacterium GW2011_GWF2_33_332]HBS48233.1 hypothetical protein [Candidatus Dependentiae bacterium]HBZ73659.1 hypothetical protein [Candidatus Dependentiae bacterium]
MNLSRKSEAFTLIEIVIALSLAVALMATVFTIVKKFKKQASVKETIQIMGVIKNALLLYSSDTNKYPTTREGLAILLVPRQGTTYLDSEKFINDAWGNPIEYHAGQEIQHKEFKIYELISQGDPQGGGEIVLGD